MSQILERPSIGEYWNISGVPVLPENVIFRSLERAGSIQKQTILERKNGLVYCTILVYQYLGLEVRFSIFFSMCFPHDQKYIQNNIIPIIIFRAGVRAVVILMPLLGITWVFGILQLDQTSTIVFAYLFTICNGLQVNARQH